MTSHLLLRACWAAGCLHLAAPAAAAPDAVPPRMHIAPPQSTATTLAGALDAAWQRSLEQSLTEGQRQRAQAEQGLAARPWAASPQLEFSQRRDRWHRNRGATESEVSLGVPLWLLGQRDAQRAAAAGLIQLADAEQAAARLQLAGQLREQAWGLKQLESAWRQAAQQAENLQTLAADVVRRVQAGDLADTDRLAAQAEALAADDEARQAEQAWRQAREQWRLLTGQTSEVAADESVVDAVSLPDEHPLLRQAEARLAHAQRRATLSRESGRDAPELRLGWRQAQGARGAEREGAVLIGVRIPLEADRRNGVALAEAQAAVHQAERERARLHEQLTAAVQLAQAALAVAQMQADSRATQRRLLRERATWLERAFQAGETALPDLLRALAAAAQADAAHHQSQVALGLARARLHQSLGLAP